MSLYLQLAFLSILEIILLLSSPFSYAKLFTRPEDVPSRTYDFIIVGAGTAGSVLASRLSEDPHKSVLVIEAGVSDSSVSTIQIPFLASSLRQTSVDWNYTTVPQSGLNGRSLTVPRGFVTGGSSSINSMAWTRGSSDLWNSYAKITNDVGWSWDSIQSYWKKISTLVPPTSNDAITPDQIPLSNSNGPVLVNLPNYDIPPRQQVFDAANTAQDPRFRFTRDVNSGDSLGFGYNQASAGHGFRSSSATAYLNPALATRSNLDLLINTRVTRLVNDPVIQTKPVFKQVELAQSPHGDHLLFKATDEVILSAGTFGSAQILLLSGIGPKDELEKVIVDSPDVGKNLKDHPVVQIYFTVNSTDTLDSIFRNSTLTAQLLAEWQQNKTGILSDTPINVFGLLQLPDTFFTSVDSNPASGPKSPNLEMIFNAFSATPTAPAPSAGNFLSVVIALVSPTSAGSIKLVPNSTDTFTAPLIDFQVLATDFDMSAMVQAINDTEKFLSAPSWTRDGYLIGPFGEFANATTADARLQYIRNNADTIHHPVGTLKMGRNSPAQRLGGEGVVDPRLNVRGIQGVRVVDASILPAIPECHTQAVVYIVAERAADMIKQAFGMLGH
ncbi:hypothetical protein D9758_001766 [Tetrapyrgos nigripes]|uniref:Uncharacterized protein n=1 Tax=Tetrapyrgos nigripes TaxID=182062 RepID=A0A8H5GXJ3_9AGAR|nr:hypothetical protein D9758_001766 [Tetrapyrgos nigripes]